MYLALESWLDLSRSRSHNIEITAWLSPHYPTTQIPSSFSFLSLKKEMISTPTTPPTKILGFTLLLQKIKPEEIKITRHLILYSTMTELGTSPLHQGTSPLHSSFLGHWPSSLVLFCPIFSTS